MDIDMLLWYLTVVMLVWSTDALFCIAMDCRFKVWKSLIAATLFPITIPIVIVATTISQKGKPEARDVHG